MKQLLSFNGRMARLNYFLVQIAAMIVMVFAAIFAGFAGNVVGERDLMFVFLGGPVFVVGMWVYLTTTVQRLHDIGLPGWHLLWIEGFLLVSSLFDVKDALGLVVNVAAIALSLYLMLMPGEDKENAYGPVPA